MKQIFIFRKTYAAVILIGYLMAFSYAKQTMNFLRLKKRVA